MSMDEDVDTPLPDEDEMPRKKLSGKKLVMLLVIPLLIAGTGAGVWYSGILSPAEEETDVAEAEQAETLAPDEPGVFLDLDDQLVNLNAAGSRQPRFLKIAVSLELEQEEDLAAVQALMPRVVDQFQVYLRELRIEDLRGSEGVYRLRQELLTRVSLAAHPIEVRDVLFREILVQ